METDSPHHVASGAMQWRCWSATALPGISWDELYENEDDGEPKARKHPSTWNAPTTGFNGRAFIATAVAQAPMPCTAAWRKKGMR